ncbi:SRPBCC domain-containing protein [Ureibacillus acetophenoni]|uniref:Activator of Hsp90 ATPase-like protein n=1 Tax=Ureibacillus acetophenoni TaxID=614649 RepID=A0A285U273_9BACL|nr:SRPBCC domain-containing protein [Ureibacillus acetophenoni]SOC36034.1 activator of Hsp90 ATPase-like protein [Ureibacillus acetophenoni]
MTIATLTKNGTKFTAEYVNEFHQPTEKVWDSITNNEHFKKWMAHLEIVDMRKDGKMLFHYNDGSDKFEEMKITDFEDQSVIEFEWGEV